MHRGSIVFDCNFSMEITDVNLRRGRVALTAQGKLLKTVPQGVVPYAIYGADGILIAVSSADLSVLLARHHARRGDTIILDLDLTIEYLRGGIS